MSASKANPNLKYFVLEDEHDGEGWFRPLGSIEMDLYEAKEFIKEQHYAFLADVREFGCNPDYEPDFTIISVNEYYANAEQDRREAIA